MGNLDLEIPEGVYEYLVIWGLSNGYAVRTNEDNNILYGLENRDPVVDLKAWKEATATTATMEEALNLIANLSHLKGNEAIPYAPAYSPQIRVDEEMYHNHLKPAREDMNWVMEAHHEGVFWFIQRVREEGAADIVCRSEVTAFIRTLEYKRRIAPFLVIREKGTQSIQWKGKQIDSLQKALGVVQREKERHAPGDWKVWEDVTATARAIVVTDDMESEAGFMIIAWFPGEVAGEYWEKEYCEGLQQALLAIVRMQEFEPDAVCAVYVCRHHEALEEEVRESLRLYSGGRLIREPSEADVTNKMRRLEEEEQKPIQPKKPEDCPICYRVWKQGSLIANGFAQMDDPEAVAQSVKHIMTSGIAPGMDNAVLGWITRFLTIRRSRFWFIDLLQSWKWRLSLWHVYGK